MSNKILILSTSPRLGGNSDQLCDALMRGAEEAGALCKKIRTDTLTIGGCSACGACRTVASWECCIKRDDFQALFDKMQGADSVVFATPVYFYDVSSQLKLIFDRSYCSYKQIKFRHAAFIATMNSDDMEKMNHVIHSYDMYLHCIKTVDSVGVITAGGMREPGAVQNVSAIKDAYNLGKKLAVLPE